MRARRQREALTITTIAAAAVALGSADAAAARTVTVNVGLPPAVGAVLTARRVDAAAFFPSTAVIRAGDAVRFTFAELRVLPRFGRPVSPATPAETGFHTVDIPSNGRGPLPLLVPSAAAARGTDAAGSVFWFRGLETFVINPRLQAARSAGVRTYTGRKRVVSGLPTASRPAPMTVRFTRPGTYRYFCNHHRGMHGTVRVLPRSAPIRSGVSRRPAGAAWAPSSAALRAGAGREIAAVVRRGDALARGGRFDGTVSVGRAAAGGVIRYAFSPSRVTVGRGRALRFEVPRDSFDVHTVTAGPGDPDVDGGTYLRGLAQSIHSSAPDPVATYSSDPPTLGIVSYTPQLHGNGFWNAGVLDADPLSAPPAQARLRFAVTGTYHLFCLIHPSMRLDVTVS